MSTPSPPSKGAEEERGESTKTVKAESGENGGTHINIKVLSQTADDVSFRVKREVKMRRVMDMYCGKYSLNPMAVVFVDPLGRPIRPYQTPDELGLEDGDEIDMLLRQGGSTPPADADSSATPSGSDADSSATPSGSPITSRPRRQRRPNPKYNGPLWNA